MFVFGPPTRRVSGIALSMLSIAEGVNVVRCRNLRVAVVVFILLDRNRNVSAMNDLIRQKNVRENLVEASIP